MRTIQLRYNQNAHQREFHADDVTKFLHLNGGFGSGKSYALAMKAFKLSYINRGIPGGCVVPSIADFKKDLLPLLEGVLDENRIKFRYHITDKWFQFPWTTARMYIATAEKPLRGPNWGWAVINESTLIEHVRYKEVVGRVRVKNTPCPQIASCGTPEGIGHWKYEVFVEKPMQNSRVIYGDTRDNLMNLADDYVQSLMHSYDEKMLEAYLRGLFVNMNSNRFYYAYDPAKNLDKEITQIKDAEIHVSMDFNVDPMTATLWHIVPVYGDNGKSLIDAHGQPIRKLLAFDQIELGGQAGADTNQMADALLSRGCHPDITTIYPDPAGKARSTSGPPDITILKNKGYYKIKFRNVAPQFRRRQLAVNNLLDKSLLQVNPATCLGIKKDLEAVEQDPITFGKVKDNPKLTHFSDGLDYMVDIEFPLSGAKPPSGMLRVR